MSPSVNHRAAALAVLCAMSLMIVLDSTIVAVAVPDIQRDLGFSPAGVAWGGKPDLGALPDPRQENLAGGHRDPVAVGRAIAARPEPLGRDDRLTHRAAENTV